MVSAARFAFVGLVWLYLAGVVVQTFLAGVAIFTPQRDFDLHRNLGYLLHLAPIGLLLVALVARVGRPLIWWTVALLVVQGIQPLLPMLRSEMPWAAALHPVLVLAIAWIGVTLGVKAWGLARSPQPESTQGA
jgi:hypothetical protein